MKVQFHTSLFGKNYAWCEDVDGKTVLVKVGDDGELKIL